MLVQAPGVLSGVELKEGEMMTGEQAIIVLSMVEAHGLADEAKKVAMQALEFIDKIADIVEGTIEDIDYDEAMDMLYDIKDVLKDYERR